MHRSRTSRGCTIADGYTCHADRIQNTHHARAAQVCAMAVLQNCSRKRHLGRVTTSNTSWCQGLVTNAVLMERALKDPSLRGSLPKERSYAVRPVLIPNQVFAGILITKISKIRQRPRIRSSFLILIHQLQALADPNRLALVSQCKATELG